MVVRKDQNLAVQLVEKLDGHLVGLWDSEMAATWVGTKVDQTVGPLVSQKAETKGLMSVFQTVERMVAWRVVKKAPKKAG